MAASLLRCLFIADTLNILLFRRRCSLDAATPLLFAASLLLFTPQVRTTHATHRHAADTLFRVMLMPARLLPLPLLPQTTHTGTGCSPHFLSRR